MAFVVIFSLYCMQPNLYYLKRAQKNVSHSVKMFETDASLIGGSSLTNEKDHHYFLNRFVCVGEFFDG